MSTESKRRWWLKEGKEEQFDKSISDLKNVWGKAKSEIQEGMSKASEKTPAQDIEKKFIRANCPNCKSYKVVRQTADYWKSAWKGSIIALLCLLIPVFGWIISIVITVGVIAHLLAAILGLFAPNVRQAYRCTHCDYKWVNTKDSYEAEQTS